MIEFYVFILVCMVQVPQASCARAGVVVKKMLNLLSTVNPSLGCRLLLQQGFQKIEMSLVVARHKPVL